MARKPDYQLSYLNKTTEEKGVIGCGWQNDNGSISVKLNPLVVMQAGPSVVFTLFPVAGKPVVEEERF